VQELRKELYLSQFSNKLGLGVIFSMIYRTSQPYLGNCGWQESTKDNTEKSAKIYSYLIRTQMMLDNKHDWFFHWHSFTALKDYTCFVFKEWKLVKWLFLSCFVKSCPYPFMFQIVPSYRSAPPPCDIFVRAQFEYDPLEDDLIPCAQVLLQKNLLFNFCCKY